MAMKKEHSFISAYQSFTPEQLDAVRVVQLARYEFMPNETLLQDIGAITVEQVRRQATEE